MKKIISIIMIVLVGITIIPKTLTNEKHTVLESTTSVYTKEEVDSLLSAIRTNITNNTNELTNIKSELTTLQNSLKDYALKMSLNTTNSNIDGLNTIVENNTARIESLENSITSSKIEYITVNVSSAVSVDSSSGGYFVNIGTGYKQVFLAGYSNVSLYDHQGSITGDGWRYHTRSNGNLQSWVKSYDSITGIATMAQLGGGSSTSNPISGGTLSFYVLK